MSINELENLATEIIDSVINKKIEQINKYGVRKFEKKCDYLGIHFTEKQYYYVKKVFNKKDNNKFAYKEWNFTHKHENKYFNEIEFVVFHKAYNENLTYEDILAEREGKQLCC